MDKIYYDEQEGSICDEGGAVVFEPDSIEHLSVEQRRRLAQIYSENPDITYLEAELLIPYDPDD